MRTMTLLTTLVLALATIGLNAGAGGSADQEGGNSDCLDYNVLWEHDGVYSPAAALVDTTPGATYTITSSDGTPFVDFYNEDGRWLAYNQGDETGTVPDSAVVGTICVGLLGTFPDAPFPGTTWTYSEA